ncbi:hypothetical protein BGZ76_006611 [Entomortierella beljakovae]|nr:hypothetical protein BGZ76_006611 [Entomortierella beljakovae]
MASSISWSQFQAFWPIPVFYLIFSVTSWLVAKVGSRVLRFSRDEEKFVIASVLFSNTNTLPMALLQSLAFSAAGNRLLRDEFDTKEAVAARGMSYILFYAIFGNLVRWSYGFSLLVPKDEEEEEHSPRTMPSSPSVLINVDTPSGENGPSFMTLPEPFPAFVPTSNNPLKNSNSSFLLPTAVHPKSSASSIRSISESVIIRTATSAYERVKTVLTPPLLTALVSLVIGLVPALHQLFMSPDSTVYRFLVHPIESCGNAAIPMILLCLGAQVVNFANFDKSSKKTSSKSRARGAHNDELSNDEERNQGYLSPNKPYNTMLTSGTSSTATLHHFNQYSDRSFDSGPSHRGLRGSTSSASGSEDSYEDESSPLLALNRVFTEQGDADDSYLIPFLTPISFSLIARLLIVPVLCLLPIMFHPDNLAPALTMDPTFSLALVLIVAAPTAINVIQMCQIKGFFEMEMASILFWSYCVLGIPCILGWSLVGLWVAGRE